MNALNGIVLTFALASFPAAALAESCNTTDRSVLLILDASGSMNAKLPNGETRIAVAQRAIKGVAALLPGEAQLALRLYGSESPRERKNCEDSKLAVAFGPASGVGVSIAASADGVTAQGYTPIAYSLGLGAGDFTADATDRVIVLVSDGKETCKGDPLVAAKSLAKEGVTVHTIGFIVDTAARMQLQAIARATGGSYFDAPVGPELPATIAAAISACKKKVALLPKKPKPGKLRTTSAIFSLPVFNSESGEQVGTLDRVTLEVPLPAGTYEVKFGASNWKGIEVRPGETTVIEPGELKMTPNARAEVVNSETGASFGSFDAVTPALTLMPGLYDLRFGSSEWRFIKVDGGKTTILRPVEVSLARELKWEHARVTTNDGKEVARFDAVTLKAVLPPGDYIVEVDGSKVPFPAVEGDALELKPQ